MWQIQVYQMQLKKFLHEESQAGCCATQPELKFRCSVLHPVMCQLYLPDPISQYQYRTFTCIFQHLPMTAESLSYCYSFLFSMNTMGYRPWGCFPFQLSLCFASFLPFSSLENLLILLFEGSALYHMNFTFKIFFFFSPCVNQTQEARPQRQTQRAHQ